jgi:tetratricopeptide (TPR) repeat protein
MRGSQKISASIAAQGSPRQRALLEAVEAVEEKAAGQVGYLAEAISESGKFKGFFDEELKQGIEDKTEEKLDNLNQLRQMLTTGREDKEAMDGRWKLVGQMRDLAHAYYKKNDFTKAERFYSMADQEEQQLKPLSSFLKGTEKLRRRLKKDPELLGQINGYLDQALDSQPKDAPRVNGEIARQFEKIALDSMDPETYDRYQYASWRIVANDLLAARESSQ